MQVTLENLSGLERKLQITIPAEQVAHKVQAKLSDLTTKVKLPGFRPGKVPFNVIQAKYSKTAYADVVEKLLQETYAAALQQEKLSPAGLPDIKIVSSKPNEQFVYTAVFEIYPEIKLTDFKQLEVEKDLAKVTDADVDEMLQKMQKQHATWQEIADVTRKAKEGDQLTVDFTATPDEADKEGKVQTEKEVKFVLGDGYMWPDFERSLYDVKVGEEKQFSLQMPATHVDKTLAGKKINFIVKVHKICEPILPPLDDEFAARMHIKEGGLTKLREEVRKHMERELEGILQALFKQAVMDKLLEANNPVAVPKTLIAKELHRYEEDWQRRVTSKNNAEPAPVFPWSEFEQQAQRNIALGLLVSAIIKEHQITVSHQEVREKIKELVAAYYEDKEAMVNKLLADQNHLLEIEARLLEEKVVAYLATQIKIIEKNISYKEAIAKR